MNRKPSLNNHHHDVSVSAAASPPRGRDHSSPVFGSPSTHKKSPPPSPSHSREEYQSESSINSTQSKTSSYQIDHHITSTTLKLRTSRDDASLGPDQDERITPISITRSNTRNHSSKLHMKEDYYRHITTTATTTNNNNNNNAIYSSLSSSSGYNSNISPSSATTSTSSSIRTFFMGRHDSKRQKTFGHISSFLPLSASSDSDKTKSIINAATATAATNNGPNNVEEKTTATTATAIASSSSSSENVKISILEQENEILRQTIAQLEKDNQRLETSHASQKIVIEQFEGEGLPMVDVYGETVDGSWWGNGADPEQNITSSLLANDEEAIAIQNNMEDSCEKKYPDGACPLEPNISFKDALRDRACWLVGLLTLQSMSGFILQRNELLLQTHPVIVYFLTMLVGAGGNAGNQAAVRVIRGIALGTLNENTQKLFIAREFKMAISLSALLSVAGFIRAIVFKTPIPETIAVTSALAIIVFISICFGAILPLLLKKINVDPAHSSTSIQVIMDILGVVLTVMVSTLVLDSAIGQQLVSKLTGNDI